MPIDPCRSTLSLENEKFVENCWDEVTIHPNNCFAPPANVDAIDASHTSTVSTYEFYEGGIGGTLIQTVVITYTNASRQLIDSAVVTRP